MSAMDWQDLGDLKIRVTTIPSDSRGSLPEGRAELDAVAALRAKFGGEDWRRASQARRSVRYGVETSSKWRNEYGVEVEVMT